MFGGKGGAGVYQLIINLMPPHDTYIEAFLGSGIVMRKKAPARRSIGIDLNIGAHLNFVTPYDGVTLSRCDALRWLDEFTPRDKTLIYCDPPYVHSTRTGHDRYKYEMSDGDHERMISILSNIGRAGCQIMISGYRNPIYEIMLSEWKAVDYRAMTRGGPRTETLWMNFEPGEVHWHNYAGSNFTDRQRIKRKAQRWAAMYQRLDPAERQAVLAAMLSAPMPAGVDEADYDPSAPDQLPLTFNYGNAFPSNHSTSSPPTASLNRSK